MHAAQLRAADANLPTPEGFRRSPSLRAPVQKQTNIFFISESRRPMQRSFALPPAIAHEAPGCDSRYCGAVRVGATSQKNANNRRVSHAFTFAQRGVQRRFAGFLERAIHIRAILDQKLAQKPVAVEARAVQIQIAAERGERFAVRRQKTNRAHIPVICAPANQRYIPSQRRGRIAVADILEYEVRAAIRDSLEHGNTLSPSAIRYSGRFRP